MIGFEKITELEKIACEHGSDSVYFTTMMVNTKKKIGEKFGVLKRSYPHQYKIDKVCSHISNGFSIVESMRLEGLHNYSFSRLIGKEKKSIIIKERIKYKLNKNK